MALGRLAAIWEGNLKVLVSFFSFLVYLIFSLLFLFMCSYFTGFYGGLSDYLSLNEGGLLSCLVCR